MKRIIRHNPAIGILCFYLFFTACNPSFRNPKKINSYPEIFPAYYDLIIPPNIAPLNFNLLEEGSRYRLEISAENSRKIVLGSRTAKIKIPVKAWKKILAGNSPGQVHMDIMVYREGNWYKYKTINHKISEYPIDPFLVYRLVHAVYLKWRDMGIYQRDLGSFNEFPVIENTSTDHGCMNCHAFSERDPSKMLIHFRILHPGTLIWNDGKLEMVNTSTDSTLSAGIYPAWHPDGRHIAFATGKINPHLTTRSDKVVEVADRASDLIVYNTSTRKVSTSPVISADQRENMPLWSPCGKYLYFISSPEVREGDHESLLYQGYDLMRISFDAETETWGEPELVLGTETTGKSISMPSFSPDGRFLVCSMSDYGYFSIFHKESDLYLINPESGDYRKMELNSPAAESYSSWSSNGRWLVFSSKFLDDVMTRPFIAYIDSSGHAFSPFPVPLEDPDMFYFIDANFNRPELIKAKIRLNPLEIRDLVNSEAKRVEFKP